MSQVFAKVRIRGNRNKYRKILSTTEQVYHSPDELINSSCVYSPGANIDEGEWFKISEFSQKVSLLSCVDSARSASICDCQRKGYP